jgi:hypothetical protein
MPYAAHVAHTGHYGVGMECGINEVLMHYVEHGGGVVYQDDGAYDVLEPAQRAGFDEYFVVRTGHRSPLPRPCGAR